MKILILSLHPCAVLLSDFLWSTTVAAQILHWAFCFFPSHRVCGAQQASVIHPVLSTVLYKRFYRKDHLVVGCPNAHLLPPAPVQCHSASPWQVLSHQVFLSEGTRGCSTSPETVAGIDTFLRFLFLRRNKSQFIFKLEMTIGPEGNHLALWALLLKSLCHFRGGFDIHSHSQVSLQCTYQSDVYYFSMGFLCVWRHQTIKACFGTVLTYQNVLTGQTGPQPCALKKAKYVT